MKNLYYANAAAIQAWAANLTTNALSRTTLAMKEISDGNYKTEDLLRDVYRYLEDLSDYPYGAATGALPIAYLTISAWVADADSNVIPLPIPRDLNHEPDLSTFELSQFEEKNDGRALFAPAYASLQLGEGTKSVSVKILAGQIPEGERPPRGLYHGSIYRLIDGEPKPAAEVHVHVR